jgi:hypothetical protein
MVAYRFICPLSPIIGSYPKGANSEACLGVCTASGSIGTRHQRIEAGGTERMDVHERENP